MIMSVLVLVVSSALFLFYLQTICEQALRREFSRAYSKNIVEAVQLQYPELRDAVASEGKLDYSQARLALKCDFFSLHYLLKNGDPARRHLVRGERLLGVYFRFLLFSLSVRHAFNLQERHAMLKMASILQYFANAAGEKLNVSALATAEANIQS